MDKNQFGAILPIIVADFVARAAERYLWTENEAFLKIYASELYKYLESEETKLWQYSTDKLLSLFDDELNGRLTLLPY
ncbi:MAG: hypothetical protein LBT20_02660 [Clostridiales bacterium]|jgi:hypothetical protein|nr:hypothetical protein [Clostridiales bacterium]